MVTLVEQFEEPLPRFRREKGKENPLSVQGTQASRNRVVRNGGSVSQNSEQSAATMTAFRAPSTPAPLSQSSNPTPTLSARLASTRQRLAEGHSVARDRSATPSAKGLKRRLSSALVDEEREGKRKFMAKRRKIKGDDGESLSWSWGVVLTLVVVAVPEPPIGVKQEKKPAINGVPAADSRTIPPRTYLPMPMDDVDWIQHISDDDDPGIHIPLEALPPKGEPSSKQKPPSPTGKRDSTEVSVTITHTEITSTAYSINTVGPQGSTNEQEPSETSSIDAEDEDEEDSTPSETGTSPPSDPQTILARIQNKREDALLVEQLAGIYALRSGEVDVDEEMAEVVEEAGVEQPVEGYVRMEVEPVVVKVKDVTKAPIGETTMLRKESTPPPSEQVSESPIRKTSTQQPVQKPSTPPAVTNSDSHPTSGAETPPPQIMHNPPEATNLPELETDSESEYTDDSDPMGDSIWDLVLPRTKPVAKPVVKSPTRDSPVREGEGSGKQEASTASIRGSSKVDSPKADTGKAISKEDLGTSRLVPTISEAAETQKPKLPTSDVRTSKTRDLELIELDDSSETEQSVDHETARAVVSSMWPGEESSSDESMSEENAITSRAPKRRPAVEEDSSSDEELPVHHESGAKSALYRALGVASDDDESDNEPARPALTRDSVVTQQKSARRSRFHVSTDEEELDNERENERRAEVPHWDVHDVSEDGEITELSEEDDDPAGLEDFTSDVWKQDEPNGVSRQTTTPHQQGTLPRRIPPSDIPSSTNAEAGPSRPLLLPIRPPSPNAEAGPSQLTPRRSGWARHPPALDPAYIQQPESPPRRGRGRGRGGGRGRGRGRGGAFNTGEAVEEEWHENEEEIERAIALSQIENEAIDERWRWPLRRRCEMLGVLTEEQQLQMAIEASKREHRRRRAPSSLEEREVEEVEEDDDE